MNNFVLTKEKVLEVPCISARSNTSYVKKKKKKKNLL
jgi:hypothetical protein